MDGMTLLIVVAIVAVVFGIVIAGMAVGVIFSNRQIKGSCGGLASMRDGDGKSPCMVCGGSPDACEDAGDDVARPSACDGTGAEMHDCGSCAHAAGAEESLHHR